MLFWRPFLARLSPALPALNAALFSSVATANMSFKSSTSSLFAKKAARQRAGPRQGGGQRRDGHRHHVVSAVVAEGQPLAAVSWDGKMRVYSVAADLRANGVAMMAAEAPLLSCDWSKVSDVV